MGWEKERRERKRGESRRKKGEESEVRVTAGNTRWALPKAGFVS